LIDNAVHALIKEVNSQGTPAYQEETERKSSIIQTEGEIKIINNFTTNLISEERLLTISKEI